MSRIEIELPTGYNSKVESPDLIRQATLQTSECKQAGVAEASGNSAIVEAAHVCDDDDLHGAAESVKRRRPRSGASQAPTSRTRRKRKNAGPEQNLPPQSS